MKTRTWNGIAAVETRHDLLLWLWYRNGAFVTLIHISIITLEPELLLWLWDTCYPFSYQCRDTGTITKLLHCGFHSEVIDKNILLIKITVSEKHFC